MAPPALSGTIRGFVCEPLNAATPIPFGVQSDSPRALMCCAKMSVPVRARLSSQAMIAPPAPSEAITGERWFSAAVEIGVFTPGLVAHWARLDAGTEITRRVATQPRAAGPKEGRSMVYSF